MKTFVLIWKNIRYYYVCSRSVFTLFIVGLLSASLLLIFLYGNLNPSVTEYSIDSISRRRYTFSFSSESDTNVFEAFLFQHNTPSELTHLASASVIDYNGNKNDEFYTIGCETVSESNKFQHIRGRTYFNETELAEGANVAIVSESVERYTSGNTLQLGKDTINVNGVDFTVIGVTYHWKCSILIPAASYAKNDFPITSISATMENRPSYYENLEFLRDMREQFPNVSISKHPYSSYENSKRDTLSVMLVLSVVFAAAIAAFMFLLKYLSDSTDYIGAIQSICGAPKDTVVFIKLASVFLMTFSVSAVGVALHALLYGPVFSKLNTIQGLIYQPRDYLLILCMCCIAAVLVSVPFVVSFSRGSAAAFKRRLE